MINGIEIAIKNFKSEIINIIYHHIDDEIEKEIEKYEEKNNYIKELLNRYQLFLENAVLYKKYKLPKQVLQELEEDYNIIKNEINKS